MNKILLFLLFLGLFFNNYAQITVANDSVYEVYNVNEQDLAVKNTHASSAPPATVNWKLFTVDVPSNWISDYFVCDAVQCWDESVNGNAYTLDDNKQNPLDVHFLNNGNTGVGHAELLVWEDGDSLNTFKIIKYTVKVDVGINVEDISKTEISVFPNPVSNALNIKNINTALISKIELFNVIGKKVVSIEKPNALEIINLEKYNKGVYILKITDNNQNNYSQNIIKN